MGFLLMLSKNPITYKNTDTANTMLKCMTHFSYLILNLPAYGRNNFNCRPRRLRGKWLHESYKVQSRRSERCKKKSTIFNKTLQFNKKIGKMIKKKVCPNL